MLIKFLKTMLLCVFAFLGSANATIQILTTRVVFNAAEKEQTVRINNVGTDPELIQVWLSSSDKGDGTIKESLPFFINPPASRVNAQKGKVFRVFQIQEAVSKYPKDRETLLWLNVLDIPPDAPEGAGQNQLKMAFRTMIKFFYRPAGLKSNPQDAADNLHWELRKATKGYDVIATNNSPYHVSMTKVWLTDGQGKDIEIMGDMIVPYDTLTYHFPQVATISGKGTFKYNYITDLGAYIKKTYSF